MLGLFYDFFKYKYRMASTKIQKFLSQYGPTLALLVDDFATLLLQLPAFFKASGPAIPPVVQKYVELQLLIYSKGISSILAKLVKIGGKSTIEPFTTRQTWLANLYAIRNRFLFLNDTLINNSISTGINTQLAEKEINFI